ncbi:MAG: iron-sulfur cluster assembly scaffold protein [Candidatus Saccharibacteria bacterium]|nr:iron-sulfur cluster assembly scaffold protein [Candidatus Saccharibacteria bacterium]
MTTKEENSCENQGWVYSDIVKEHFLNPRNFLMGDESKFEADAIGLVGNPICGDQMKMFLKIKNDIITDIKWKTYGCASAIASTSALSELAKGKTLDEALKIDAKQIDDYLGTLPKHKFHCSILGHDALKDAINNYRNKENKV